MLLAILASAILWPLYTLVDLILTATGLVLIAPLAYYKLWVWRESQVFPPKIVTAWKGGWLTWLWGNEEDGVTGPGWWEEREVGRQPGAEGYDRAVRQATYKWSALRNSSNNLRFVKRLNLVIDPAKIRSVKVGKDGWFCWHGLYAGLCLFPTFRGAMFRFWIGWKVKPEDKDGIPDWDMRKPRCGFAVQFKRND